MGPNQGPEMSKNLSCFWEKFELSFQVVLSILCTGMFSFLAQNMVMFNGGNLFQISPSAQLEIYIILVSMPTCGPSNMAIPMTYLRVLST